MDQKYKLDYLDNKNMKNKSKFHKKRLKKLSRQLQKFRSN